MKAPFEVVTMNRKRRGGGKKARKGGGPATIAAPLRSLSASPPAYGSKFKPALTHGPACQCFSCWSGRKEKGH